MVRSVNGVRGRECSIHDLRIFTYYIKESTYSEILSLPVFYLRLEFDNEYKKAHVNLKTFIVSAIHVVIFPLLE